MVQLLKAGASTVLFDPVLQLDTMGIFHNEYPGADSPVTGLVTLLANFIKKSALFVKGLYREDIISMRTCEFLCV